MADFQDIVTRLVPESSHMYVYPNVSVTIYESGTSNLAWSGQTDANGVFAATGLSLGRYDIKVNGELHKTIELVTVDYAQKFTETWTTHKSGSISGDADQSADKPIFGPGRAGVIERISWSLHHINASGDITIHVLKGDKDAADALTVASDSAHNWQINPGSEYYAHAGNQIAPNIAVAAGEVVTIGWDYTAGTVEGLTVVMIFKPDEE